MQKAEITRLCIDFKVEGGLHLHDKLRYGPLVSKCPNSILCEY